jgi:hypothetical protein
MYAALFGHEPPAQIPNGLPIEREKPRAGRLISP